MDGNVCFKILKFKDLGKSDCNVGQGGMLEMSDSEIRRTRVGCNLLNSRGFKIEVKSHYLKEDLWSF